MRFFFILLRNYVVSVVRVVQDDLLDPGGVDPHDLTSERLDLAVPGQGLRADPGAIDHEVKA